MEVFAVGPVTELGRLRIASLMVVKLNLGSVDVRFANKIKLYHPGVIAIESNKALRAGLPGVPGAFPVLSDHRDESSFAQGVVLTLIQTAAILNGCRVPMCDIKQTQSLAWLVDLKLALASEGKKQKELFPY